MARGHGNRGRALAALVLILFGTAAPVFADKADPLVTGIKTFEQGKYDAAIKLLTTAFDDKTRTRSDTATALFYRGKAMLNLDRSAAALSDLKAALWLNALSPAHREEARRLETGILQAAGLSPASRSEPARRAGQIAPPTATSSVTGRNWSTKVNGSSARARAKPEPQPSSWRAEGEAVSRRSLPPAVHSLPPEVRAANPPSAVEQSTELSAQAPAPVITQAAKSPSGDAVQNPPSSRWASTPVVPRGSTPAASVPVVTGSIARPQPVPAAPVDRTELPPVRAVASQSPSPAPPVSLPVVNVPAAPVVQAARPSPATLAATTPANSVPDVTGSVAAEPDSAPASPSGPSLSTVTDWLTGTTPSPVQDQIKDARQLEVLRLERIRRHNEAMLAGQHGAQGSGIGQ